MTKIRTLILICAPGALLAGCAQAPSAADADLQQRAALAEARADAAEKRAKNAEIAASLHAQEPVAGMQPTTAPDKDPADNDFGKPVNDTMPIEPVPVVPAQGSQ
jgi:hypothetical protein